MGDGNDGVTFLDHANAVLLKTALGDLDSQADELNTYADTYVFSKVGFDGTFSLLGQTMSLCALQPIADVMDKCATAMDTVTKTFHTHWDGIMTAVEVATGLISDTDDDGSGRPRPGGGPS